MQDNGDMLNRLVAFMETDNGQRISVVTFSVLATLILLTMPGTMASIIFGMPLIFFVPGFAVTRIFFWKGTSIEEKFALSLGLSIIVVIILALILVLTPISLYSSSTQGSLVVFTIGAVAFEMLKNRKGAKSEKPEVQTRVEKTESFKLDKVVAVMIGTALVVSGICLALIITAEYPSRTYFAMTEDGSANINSTRELGSTITLTIEMHNGEDGTMGFSLESYGSNISDEAHTWHNHTMSEGDTWEKDVSFLLDQTGIVRLDFNLYIQPIGGDAYLYGNLHIWLLVE
ncbi:MAG: DUF1616 domain-containing protein [Thermoplasmata archaeon]|nr:DUF1616 domain-containing protein [Thermoplasmata archaeon]